MSRIRTLFTSISSYFATSTVDDCGNNANRTRTEYFHPTRRVEWTESTSSTGQLVDNFINECGNVSVRRSILPRKGERADESRAGERTNQPEITLPQISFHFVSSFKRTKFAEYKFELSAAGPGGEKKMRLVLTSRASLNCIFVLLSVFLSGYASMDVQNCWSERKKKKYILLFRAQRYGTDNSDHADAPCVTQMDGEKLIFHAWLKTAEK